MRTNQVEHLFAALRVHAVGRLVQKNQTGIVDDRLGQFDPLLHAGREALDQAVAFFVEPDLIEHVGGALAGGASGQPAHLRHVADEIGRGRARRQAVRFRHVADVLADLDAVGCGCRSRAPGRARGRVGQAEQQRAAASSCRRRSRRASRPTRRGIVRSSRSSAADCRTVWSGHALRWPGHRSRERLSAVGAFGGEGGQRRSLVRSRQIIWGQCTNRPRGDVA